MHLVHCVKILVSVAEVSVVAWGSRVASKKMHKRITITLARGNTRFHCPVANAERPSSILWKGNVAGAKISAVAWPIVCAPMFVHLILPMNNRII